MRQTTLSVALEVTPGSQDHLRRLLDQLRARASDDPTGGDAPFAQFLAQIPTLHFLSLSLFPGADYDPLLVIEVNFDGETKAFWRALEKAIGDDLRACLRCCKAPRDDDAALFAEITAASSHALIAPYLERRALRPSAFHHGNRGLSRARIEAGRELFLAIRGELAQDDAGFRALAPAAIHARLRQALRPRFAWLDAPAEPRIDARENIGDYLRLAGFVIAALFALSAPGLILALFMPPLRYFALEALLAVGLGLWLSRLAGAPEQAPIGPFTIGGFLFEHMPKLVMAVAAYLLATSAIGAPLAALLTGAAWPDAFWSLLSWLLLGLASLPATIAGLLVWLRRLERADSEQAAPPVDPRLLAAMARREDWIPQNHMGSVVLIKPGVLRALIIRAGHLGLGLLLRVTARNGYLGSMRTIHFAHWAMVNNQSRLMFFSNFDQTWESYLDDFIEKAHVGLTLAWSCGVGFPPTRLLLYEGASHGRQFKEWARHSMAVSHFWFSAYKDLTADQIERNDRIALGLRRAALDAGEAEQWIADL